MQTEEMIMVNEFCIHHNIDIHFINALKDSGLIEINSSGEKSCITESQLPRLEKLVRLYYEMDINLEGIETITYLLSKMIEMQKEIMQLHNRLGIYENATEKEL